MLGFQRCIINKDIDREILLHLPDKDLLVVCGINKYFFYFICDDNFFYRKLLKAYPDTLIGFSTNNTNYKSHYLKIVNYVSKLRKEWNYNYHLGDPQKQYSLFIKSINNQGLLIEAAIEGEYELVKEAIKRGANIHEHNELALRWASTNGHYEIVKYLVEYTPPISSVYLIGQGANIHAINEQSLRIASGNGHLNIVKYLINCGANIHINNEKALKVASAYGQLDIVKCLIDYGANIHIDDNEVLKLAIKNGHIQIVEYLSSL